MSFGFVGGGSGVKNIRYCFVDAAYLRKSVDLIIDKFFDDRVKYEQLQFDRLVSGFKKTFYYDCMPKQQDDESEEYYKKKMQDKIGFHNGLQLINGWHIYDGHLRKNGRVNVQKGVDVKIAVDMLLHTINGNMTEATLIAGDSDFIPLLEALNQQGMYTKLRFSTRSTSDELVYRADVKEKIDRNSVLNALPTFQKDLFKIPKIITGELTEGTERIGTLVNVNQYSSYIRQVYTQEVMYTKIRENHVLDICIIVNGEDKATTYVFPKWKVLKAALIEDGFNIVWNEAGKKIKKN